MSFLLRAIHGQRIQIDPVYLEELARKYENVSTELRILRYTPGGINRAPAVDEAYNEFHLKWDETRNEIATCVERIVDALRLVRESFEQVDADLAASLNDGSGS